MVHPSITIKVSSLTTKCTPTIPDLCSYVPNESKCIPRIHLGYHNLESFAKYVLKKYYFVSKIVLTYCEKKCSSDRENF